MTYPVILPVIVIDSTNKAIRMTENATTSTINLVEGSYFLRGDGSADDLLLALKTALDSHPNVTTPNTYTVTIARSINSAAVSGAVTVTRATGSSSWGVLWADALTTFDQALLGFVANDTVNASPKVSTVSPSGQWVSNEIIKRRDPRTEVDVKQVRTRSGAVGGGRRGGPYSVRLVQFEYVNEKRTDAMLNTTDPTAAFSSVFALLSTLRRFELHFATLATSPALAALSSTTRQGTAWHLDEASAEEFEPRKLSAGTPLYSWGLRLLGYVA